MRDPKEYTAEGAWIAQVADDTTHVVDSAMPHDTKATHDTKAAHDTKADSMYGAASRHHQYESTAAHAPAITRKSASRICEIATAAVVGAVVAPLMFGAVAPAVAGALGFSAKGIVAHSVAAGMMSTMGGAATQAGSIVATMQAIGVTVAVALSPAVAAAGAMVGASVASAAAKGSILAIDAAPTAGRDRVKG
ncbi:hypothetical protein AMAG_01507 [Allomyces macrogynus ATCC 38327]|uniref:Uncharacterized protein n=1 Tax=Allomyces macrogynus (strain ATCC 38327) TaxID=578462 RepID=A0A0L0RZX7_ALLM3|nr:hypothetical protein AMAG_01507 [Allomyces macrogynus ATCC 38327]|eukprot:KNE55619.1 hypothetical protein AMAG_01507 [Allomyces macrogynus ATCC 38327]